MENTVTEQIRHYIESLPEPKSTDLQALHALVLEQRPDAELWFLDGRNAEGKIVSNPNIGYGRQTRSYANGQTKDFYQVGLSANTSGISLYVMGLDDKTYLSRTYGEKLGKARITGYCIQFKALKELQPGVLIALLREELKA